MSDDDFWYFMSELHIAWKAGRLFLDQREANEGALRAHQDSLAALGRLRGSAARLQRYIEQSGRGVAGPVTWSARTERADGSPDYGWARLNDCFSWIEACLAEWGTLMRKDLEEIAKITTRKSASIEHVEFIGLTAKLMNEMLGKPHYEIVTNLVAVLFDKEMDTMAVRSAARKWATRRAAYSGPEIIGE
jgi:hypothetical protein